MMGRRYIRKEIQSPDSSFGLGGNQPWQPKTITKLHAFWQTHVCEIVVPLNGALTYAIFVIGKVRSRKMFDFTFKHVSKKSVSCMSSIYISFKITYAPRVYDNKNQKLRTVVYLCEKRLVSTLQTDTLLWRSHPQTALKIHPVVWQNIFRY